MTDGLRVESRGDHELWTLARPARRNALDLALLAALGEARDRAVAAGCSVVVLAAEGDVFCAGFDLGDLRRLEVREGQLPSSPLHDLIARFDPLPFTLITAIQGPAHG
ncbi:MAG: enoyl-CoA hydratase/isomerase family protein, partial [Myxococcales bacterium]